MLNIDPFCFMNSGRMKLQQGTPKKLTPKEVHCLVMEDCCKDVYTSGALDKLFAQDATSLRNETFAENAIRMFIGVPQVFGTLLHLHHEQTQQHTAVVHTALTTLHEHQREIWGLLSHSCQSRVKHAYRDNLEHLEVGTTGQPGPYMRKVREWLEQCAEHDSDETESECDSHETESADESCDHEESFDGDCDDPSGPRRCQISKRERDDPEEPSRNTKRVCL